MWARPGLTRMSACALNSAASVPSFVTGSNRWPGKGLSRGASAKAGGHAAYEPGQHGNRFDARAAPGAAPGAASSHIGWLEVWFLDDTEDIAERVQHRGDLDAAAHLFHRLVNRVILFVIFTQPFDKRVCGDTSSRCWP